MIQKLMLTLLTFTTALIGKPTPLHELHEYADGLNQEGAIISQRALTPKQKWANLCFVLDRPLDEEIDLDEITSQNPYPLKEASLVDYNELQAAYLVAIILRHYLEQGNQVILQVHRNSSGPKHLALIKKIVQECLQIEHWEESLELRYGYKPCTDYEGADVVFSLSMIAGLHKEWKSGTPVLPYLVTPFDLHSMVLPLPASYPAKNCLIDELQEILNEQDDGLLEKINTCIQSPNPDKQHLQAHRPQPGEIKAGRLLQVNGMFYPKQMWPVVEVLL